MTSDNLVRYSPILSIGIAWFIFATVMSHSLGFIGIVFDYIYILTIAIFSSYLPRSGIVFLLGFYISYYQCTYFIVTVPMMNSFPFMQSNNVMLVIISEYIVVPLIIVISVITTYLFNKFLIKRLKLQKRIGKVINV